ncbi:hypothetical protein HPP92_017615 [Vanilla planifolia]|uniref:Flavonoid 3'-monooxygenase n=1 Tax=Vanilla planifolia TaxID=51239 RepID=A0A835Q8D7_VANPL|nr:hypothetical protein HPP92_018228 [Vanilla planifolia]KAG0468287.1 hypothetical protein HPP92_017615 [Vanilla planifolia]
MAPILVLVSFFTLIFLLSNFQKLKKNKSRRRPLPPGPKGWPILGYLPFLGPKPHQTFHSLSKTYGPLLHLRLGTVDVIVPCSADMASKLLRNDMNFIERPPNSAAEHIAYNYMDLGFSPYGPRWRMLRKLCSLQLFSTKALDDFQHARRGEVSRFVRRLAEANDRKNGSAATVDVSREIAACVGLVKRMKRLHRNFDDFLNKVIEDYRETTRSDNEKKASVDDGKGNEEGTNRTRNLLNVLLDLKENADGNDGSLNDIDIKALLQNVFAAGSDSTTITAEWALAELIQHPDVLARAQAELDDVVGRNRLVEESDLPNLPYLQAVLKETFRLHPPGPLSVPRMAVADCEVGGYLIPKGSNLLLNIWAIGRDPEAWPDKPLEFRPDRFLPGGRHEGVEVRGNHFGLVPFGAGRRMCVGMNLGLRMVHLVTATILHSFDWGLPNGLQPCDLDMEENSNGLTLHRVEPILACPLPRLAPHVYQNL